MNNSTITENMGLTAKDFVSGQEVKWCRGCGDYSILKQVQTVFPELGIPREKFVFISGIGCSSRFTYYMDTFGIHGIHGRAAAIAAGVIMANPELSVWVVSGDGDSLSIGGNHFIHTLRRNFNINYLLFNNQIYSLTKGQYSPTSQRGAITNTSPFGSIEDPFDAAALALGAGGSFVARTMDTDPVHMRELLRRANEYQGTSFIEIYQNCPIFNDGAFAEITDKKLRKNNLLYLEQGKPLVFGDQDQFALKLDGLTPHVVPFNKDKINQKDLWIHDEKDVAKAWLLTRLPDFNYGEIPFPRPIGILFCTPRAVFEQTLDQQIRVQEKLNGRIPLQKILTGEKTWEVQ